MATGCLRSEWGSGSVVNYYEVLQVEQRACVAEIKTAFRKLLKRFHPDHNQHNRAWAEQRTRELVEAYQVLSDERRRRFHDHNLQRQRTFTVGTLRVETTRGEPSGAAALCHRILDDLLDGNGTRAVETYEKLRGKRSSFDFYPFLNLKDHLDCKFLLGEEYEREGKLHDALLLYEEVYHEELEGPRLRYFFEEVQERIVGIYTQQISREAGPEEAIECYQHALKLKLPEKDIAEIRKRFAETLLKLGDEAGARRELLRALRSRPGLKGVQRLCARLGIEAAAL